MASKSETDEPRRRACPAVLAFVATALLMASCAQSPPPLVYAEPHCYRTLASVDCHSFALPGESGRRVGHYQAPVD